MLFGRQDETARLLNLLENARQGEPGAGKSALLDDLEAEASDALVITSRGVETESEVSTEPPPPSVPTGSQHEVHIIVFVTRRRSRREFVRGPLPGPSR